MMATSDVIGRNDVVGMRIKRVVENEGQYVNGFGVKQVFVELQNGVAFQLEFGDPEEHRTLVHADKAALRSGKTVPLPPGFNDVVEDVVVSDYWPTLGVQLANGSIIFCMDNPAERSIGVCFDTLGGMYSKGDLRSMFT